MHTHTKGQTQLTVMQKLFFWSTSAMVHLVTVLGIATMHTSMKTFKIKQLFMELYCFFMSQRNSFSLIKCATLRQNTYFNSNNCKVRQL